MDIFQWLAPYIDKISFYDIIISVITIVVGWFIQRFFIKPLIKKIVQLLRRKESKLFGHTLAQFNRAIRFAFMTSVIFLSLSLLLEVSLFTHPKTDTLFYSFMVLFAFMGVYDTLTFYADHPQEALILGRNENLLTPFLLRVLKAMLSVLAVFTIAFMWGFNLNGFLTGIGLTSVALAFGVRDTSSHIFAGFSVGLDKPFQIGDFVATDDQKIEGFIEDINLRSTLIRTSEGTTIYVPNAYLLNRPLYNFSSREKRKVEHELYLQFNDNNANIRQFCQQLRTDLALHPLVDKQFIYVHIHNIIGDCYEIKVKYHVCTHDPIIAADVKHANIMKASDLLSKLDLQLMNVGQQPWQV